MHYSIGQESLEQIFLRFVNEEKYKGDDHPPSASVDLSLTSVAVGAGGLEMAPLTSGIINATLPLKEVASIDAQLKALQVRILKGFPSFRQLCLYVYPSPALISFGIFSLLHITPLCCRAAGRSDRQH